MFFCTVCEHLTKSDAEAFVDNVRDHSFWPSLHTLQLRFWLHYRSPLDLSGFGAADEKHRLSAPTKYFLLDLGLETGLVTAGPGNGSYRATPCISWLYALGQCFPTRGTGIHRVLSVFQGILGIISNLKNMVNLTTIRSLFWIEKPFFISIKL